jgi:protein-arginine kinase activator protein McsA
LGDGTLGNDKGVTFCTDAFSLEDNNFLADRLNDLGFCAKVDGKNRIGIPNRRVFEFLQFIGPSPLECFAYKWDSFITESYFGRKCKECGLSFDTEQNSRYFCGNSCYQKNWRKNGATIRIKEKLQ